MEYRSKILCAVARDFTQKYSWEAVDKYFGPHFVNFSGFPCNSTIVSHINNLVDVIICRTLTLRYHTERHIYFYRYTRRHNSFNTRDVINKTSNLKHNIFKIGEIGCGI